MKALLKRFKNDERGVTAVEYGLIAAAISVAILTAAQGVGTALIAKFNAISAALT